MNEPEWTVETPTGTWTLTARVSADTAQAELTARRADGAERRLSVDLARPGDDPDGIAAATPDDIRARLLEEQACLRRLATATIPRSVLDEGRLVQFGALREGRPSVLDGGTAHVDSFRYEGEDWVIEESFCANPTCRCKEGFAAFVRLGAEQRGDQGFDVQVPFGGRVAIQRVHGAVSPDRAQAVLRHYRALRPSWEDRVKRHYDEVKVIGARSLPPPRVFTRKPSANAPCPCGSGRKYKGCCGRVPA